MRSGGASTRTRRSGEPLFIAIGFLAAIATARETTRGFVNPVGNFAELPGHLRWPAAPVR
jgi:hypothetical protein